MFYSIGVTFSVILGLIFLKNVYNLTKKLFWNSNRLRMQLLSIGKWAVVTGATDGIGKAYAEYFAEKKFNVMLISRNQEKLNQVASGIETTYHVETKTIAVDFSKGYEIYEKIQNQIKSIENQIGILVNNVGMSYNYPEYYLNIDNLSEFTQNIINCNITSVNMMTGMILPLMIDQKSGIIINIASTAAKIPNPMLTIYAATKAYVCKFSEDLTAEYESKGILIQCVIPGLVVTNMTKLKKSTILSPTPKDFVQSAVKTIGIDTVTTGYYTHTIQLKLIQIFDFLLPNVTSTMILKVMKSLKQKNLKKIK